MTKRTLFGLLLAMTLTPTLTAQQPAPAPVATHDPAHHDPALESAEGLIGRALILRCFCAENNLTFDADGKPQQPIKSTDWTLAGINIQKAERKDPTTIELDGVRVAIRFAPDRREFDRHPLNDEKIKILLPDNSNDNDNGAPLQRTLDTVFAEGLDLRLQRSMPSFWQHYFLPQAPWPKDGLEAQTIVTPGTPSAPPGMTDPRPEKRSDASYTPEASHDRVQGTVILRMVVDTTGTPRRVTIAQPLGYGLDARAAQAIEKYHFEPAITTDGKPLASNVQVRQQFSLVPTP